MIHRSWRRLSLAAALLCLPAWLTACTPDEVSTTAPSSTPTRTATRTPSPTPTPTPATCDLLAPSDLEQVLQLSGWVKTAEVAKPHETGWKLQCLFNDADLTYPTVTINIETGRPPGWRGEPPGPTKDFNGRPLPRSEPEQIPNLGDEAWSALGYAQPVGKRKYLPAVTAAGIRTGSTYIVVAIRISDPGALKSADDADLASPVRLARMALERLEDPVRIEPETATGNCGRISLSAASEFSGMRLVSSRLTELGNGEYDCILGGRDGVLWISRQVGPDAVSNFRKNEDSGEPIGSLGERAYQLGTATFILSADRVISLIIGPDDPERFGKESGWSAEVTQPKRAFLNSLAAELS